MKLDKPEWNGLLTMNNVCKNHEIYYTRADAERALAQLVKHIRKTGVGGKSWKRLNAFECDNHFHIGRARKLPKCYAKPAPKEKLMTFGEARRRLRRLDEKFDRMIDHYNRKRAEYIGWLIEQDRAAGWIE